MRALLVVAALAVPVTSVVAPALAEANEPVPTKAKRLAQRGRELHDRGDYERAIVAFKEAYVIAPSSALLFNLAQAYRLQGNCDDAGLMYRRFLATNPGGQAERIANEHLATVDRCVAKRNLGIRLDDSMAYLPQAPVASPSDRVFVDTPTAPAPGKRKQQIGLALGAAGAVGLGAALYFGIQSAADANAVEKAYANGAKWKDVMDLDARGKQRASYAKLFGVTGGLAAAGGITLYALGKRDENAARITFAPSVTSAKVSLSWRF